MRSTLTVLCVLLITVRSIVQGDDQDKLSAANSAFSRLYQEVALDKTEVVYSPYSIHSALTMASQGARGDTANEMLETLGLTTFTNPHEVYHDLICEINSVTNVQLNTANGIFVNPSMPIEQNFVDHVKDNYFAFTAGFDLTAAGGPKKMINDFEDQNTKGMIKNLLPPGSIDGDTVMILVNTIFFNGTWQSKFKEYNTHKTDFKQLGGAKSQVDMMYDERSVKIRRGVNGADVAELPFKGGRFSLYIALPQQVDGITALEKLLTQPGKVDQFFDGLNGTRVRLSMPKFKLETKLTLKDALKQLGMRKAFDSISANFTGIFVGSCYIDKVIHKAMLEVTEAGTVAAAATGIIVVLICQTSTRRRVQGIPVLPQRQSNQGDFVPGKILRLICPLSSICHHR